MTKVRGPVVGLALGIGLGVVLAATASAQNSRRQSAEPEPEAAAAPDVAPDAGTEDAPRVRTQGAADGAELTLNEINSSDYPDMALFATVLRDGEPVTGLGAGDFAVGEDEVAQEPLEVEAQLPPLSVVVTVDVSGSMAQRMDATKTAAADFVDRLESGDAVQLVSFQREIATLTSMTTTKRSVTEAIGGLVARGDTALYDGLLTSLDLVAEREGRKAVVLLSDGVDDDGTGRPLSEASVDRALERAEEISVPVFVIGLGTEMDEQVLGRIAEETGGRYLPAPEADQLGQVYDSIGAQLSGQYAIRYTSAFPADGTQRRVDLRSGDLLASRTYTAPGEAEAAPAPAPASGECAQTGIIEAEREDLQRAATRYDEGLISVTDRSSVRQGAVSRMRDEIAAMPPPAPDCAVEALAAATAFYDASLISVTDRNSVRELLARGLSDYCTANGRSLDALESCIELYDRAYSDSVISVTTRNDLIDEASEPYLAALREMSDADAALERINQLYDIGSISITDRNDLRDAVLAAE